MSNERGVTLIEVLAAVTLLSLAILIYLNLSGYTRLADYRSGQQSLAEHAVENFLNEVRAYVRENTSLTKPQLDSYLEQKEIEYADAMPNLQFDSQLTPFTDLSGDSTTTLTASCPRKERTSITGVLFVDRIYYLVTITSCWGDMP